MRERAFKVKMFTINWKYIMHQVISNYHIQDFRLFNKKLTTLCLEVKLFKVNESTRRNHLHVAFDDHFTSCKNGSASFYLT